MKVRNVEKKIFAEHRSLMGTSEIDSKYKYVKLARGLPTFGVHFFLVKVGFILYLSSSQHLSSHLHPRRPVDDNTFSKIFPHNPEECLMSVRL